MDKCCIKSAKSISELDLIDSGVDYSYELTCEKCDKKWDIPITLELDLPYADEIQPEVVTPDIEDPSKISKHDVLIDKPELHHAVGSSVIQVVDVDHDLSQGDHFPQITYINRHGDRVKRSHRFFGEHKKRGLNDHWAG